MKRRKKIKTKSANSHQSIHQISTRKFSLSYFFPFNIYSLNFTFFSLSPLAFLSSFVCLSKLSLTFDCSLVKPGFGKYLRKYAKPWREDFFSCLNSGSFDVRIRQKCKNYYSRRGRCLLNSYFLSIL